MARDATARLYDVDEDSVVFKKLERTEKYDQGTIAFRARKGKMIDLDKLHESIWATRLSGGTRSGLVTLEVTTIGQIEIGQIEKSTGVSGKGVIVLSVSGSAAQFSLKKHTDKKHDAVYKELQSLVGSGKLFRVIGVVDQYQGRWPSVLKKQPVNPRRILVTQLEIME